MLSIKPLQKKQSCMYRVFIKYCVFSKILIYFPDSVFCRCQCVYTHQAGKEPALQQNKNFRKTQYLMNTLYQINHRSMHNNNVPKNINLDLDYIGCFWRSKKLDYQVKDLLVNLLIYTTLSINNTILGVVDVVDFDE